MSSPPDAPARGRVARGNAGAGGGVNRVRAKLKLALEAGNWYEAHQLYRTIYFRLSAQSRHSELSDLLYEGALSLFEHGEAGSGVDLTKLYLESLRAGDLDRGEDNFRRVARLYSHVPWDSPERDAVAAAAIRWSTPEGSQHGHPRLHQMFAHNLWRARRYPESRRHFLHSRDGRGCGAMLAEFHCRRGYPREVDLFVTGTVLQLLCLRHQVAAATTLQAYAERHPAIRRQRPPYPHPLLNFVWLLLLAIEHGNSLSAFSLLVMKYQSSLSRDPVFMEYLDKIGQSFFGVPPPERPRPGGLFGGLFDSFFNVLNEDDGDDEDRSDGDRMRSSSSSVFSRSAQGGSSRPVRMETEDLD